MAIYWTCIRFEHIFFSSFICRQVGKHLSHLDKDHFPKHVLFEATVLDFIIPMDQPLRKFDKDISSDIFLRIMKTVCSYFIYTVEYGPLIQEIKGSDPCTVYFKIHLNLIYSKMSSLLFCDKQWNVTFFVCGFCLSQCWISLYLNVAFPAASYRNELKHMK